MKRYSFLLIALVFILLSCQAQNNEKDRQRAIKSATDSDIAFNTTSVNLGKVKLYETAEADFIFKNNSSAPVIVLEAVGSCGCVSVEFPHKPIEPEQQAVIKVFYRPGSLGQFKKYAYIIYLVGNEKHDVFLYLKGRAVKP